MMVDLGKAQVFKRQVPQAIHCVVGSERAAAHLFKKFADGFGVHGGF
jgi:hypothetical protein